MLNEAATTDVVLRDGSTVCLRHVTVEDVDRLQRFLLSLSSESLYFRFLGIRALTPDRVRALVDNPAGTAIAAESGGRVVAFAGFYRDPARADRAEVAFAVADALQGHGIGTRLLEHLAGLARAQGIRTFDAYVLAGNHRMLDVFRDSGFAMTTVNERGVSRGVALAVGHAGVRSEGRHEVADGGDSLDEGVLRTPRGRRHWRQSRTRQDRLGDPSQSGDCRISRTHRAGAPDSR